MSGSSVAEPRKPKNGSTRAHHLVPSVVPEASLTPEARQVRAATLVATAVRRALGRPGALGTSQRSSGSSRLDSRADERLTGPRQSGASPEGEKRGDQ
jgi:hypothetical protein